MESKNRYDVWTILLLTAFVFFAGLFWREAFSDDSPLGYGILASLLTTCCVMCAIEIADRYMFGAGEDR